MKMPVKIQMFSIHGLIRHRNMELGRDADTGGQVKYVVEMCEELARRDEVDGVDLFTRLIADKRVSPDYAEPLTRVSDKFRIVRIQCGGRKYKRKELLWPHLDEFIDKTIQFIKKDNAYPDLIHGHYPDAGVVGLQLSQVFGTPFVYTGHSMGRAKREKLLKDGLTPPEMEKKYHIGVRIAAEEEIIRNADLIITSTRQEVDSQYGLYLNKDLARYSVIPPGINTESFYPYYHELTPGVPENEETLLARASLNEELDRFFLQTEKPLVLALCRADRRKNISGLVDAFGQDPALRTMANLAVFAGIRKNIKEMEENEKAVLTDMLLLLDKYDLYGKMAIPKRHDFTHEVPELYRIAARKKGVFVNVAFTEPFGLSLIEASASGLPIVATNDGGPRDIIKNCRNGMLVDPSSPGEVAGTIKEILSNPDLWRKYSRAGVEGVRRHYNWEAHTRNYIKEVRRFLDVPASGPAFKKAVANPLGDRLTKLPRLLVSDIDNTLLGDGASLKKLAAILVENRGSVGFGVATGRTVDSAVEVLEKHGVPLPDVVISSVGAEIYYRGREFFDTGWRTHIRKNWDRKKIRKLLDGLDFLEYQEPETQREFKISYFMGRDPERLSRIHDLLLKHRCHYNLIHSHGKYLDILPFRASKGKAIRYLSYKWGIPLNQILVCGDSGNDEEMLKGNTLGVVVANHDEELEPLKGSRGVYFSGKGYAAGILDGIEKYDFLHGRANE